VATTACSAAERKLIDIITAENRELLTELRGRPRSQLDPSLLNDMSDEELVRLFKDCAQEIARLKALRHRAIALWDGSPAAKPG
jgi:hypothetical protein